MRTQLTNIVKLILSGFTPLIALLLLVFATSCKKKEAELPPAPIPVAEPSPSPTAEVAKEKPVYVYAGDRFRDPFTPTGLTTTYQPDAIFDPQRAVVRGIIFGPQLQSAVLSVGGTGTYFVKEGRIFDIMGKYAEGFKARVSKDTVTIIGEADNVFELKLPEAEGEEKTQ